MQQVGPLERVVGVRLATGGDVYDHTGAVYDLLYREQRPAMTRVAFLLTGSNEVAEDIVQDVFVRLGGRLTKLEHPSSYLRAAVVNGCRSYFRRVRLMRRFPAPSDIPTMPVEVVEFRDALLALSDRQRSAVVLRYFCASTDEEVAGLLGCRPATVRSLLARGLAALREAIE